MSVEGLIRAFSAEHVARVTGLTPRQLAYWDETGFFSPRFAFEYRRTPHSRIYSFQDVVGLRTISLLRKEHKVPLQQLRKVARELSQYKQAPWSELVLYVLGREVVFREPNTNQMRGVLSKQYVNIPLRSIIEDVAEKANKLKERVPSQIGRVDRNRFVVHNAWVIAGTRIPTAAIRRYAAAGYEPKQIIREYPTLTPKDIRAALKHEKKLAKVA